MGRFLNEEEGRWFLKKVKFGKKLAKLLVLARVLNAAMNEDNQNKEWSQDDKTWQLLGKAAPKQPSARFADDLVRVVRLLPEADPIWPRILKFSRWSLVAACVVLAASIFIDPVKTNPNKGPVVEDHKTQWEQIENAAQAELLAAAVEHMDEFSDQDLITMIGF
jgi:negative regulator of sigma E activity